MLIALSALLLVYLLVGFLLAMLASSHFREIPWSYVVGWLPMLIGELFSGKRR